MIRIGQGFEIGFDVYQSSNCVKRRDEEIGTYVSVPHPLVTFNFFFFVFGLIEYIKYGCK